MRRSAGSFLPTIIHQVVETVMSIFRSILARSTLPVRAGVLLSALIAASALPGCAVYQKCGFKGCPGDTQITADVRAAFADHPVLQPVNVQTLDSVVYLSGIVSTSMQGDIATAVARQVKGVTRVVSTVVEAE
jgi:BON domain